MRITFSVNGVPIRLPEERWKEHIVSRHPELTDCLENVVETIGRPDFIQQGDIGTVLAIKQFHDKYLVVIYKELNPADGFVLTAYFTKRLRRRTILWKR